MKQLYYVLRNILKAKTNSIIKIVSLTLGLSVAVVLFSKVAFEVSYDKFYPDADRLFRLQRTIDKAGESAYDGPIINYPVPGAMKNDLPEVEDAVVMQHPEEVFLLKGDIQYKEKLFVADSTFFDIFGMKLIEGDKTLLGVPNSLFLSQSAAKRIFKDESPVGQTLTIKSNKVAYAVAGVFEDMPDNSHLDPDAILSLKTFSKDWKIDIGWWISRDRYVGYVKLRPGVDPKEVEAKLPEMLGKYYDVKATLGNDFEFNYFLNPVKELHSGDATMKRMIMILSLLAFALLLVSAMNYVLISISSLATRAKAIGIHKCNGATDGNVFYMFILETVVQVFISVVLSALLLFAFRGYTEELLQNSFTSIFSIDNLWVTTTVVLALVLLAGVIPATIFSLVPVTQIFRLKTASKRHWKQALLFVQFSGIAFVVSLLAIIVKQYDLLLNRDLGYTTENILVSQNAEGATYEQFNLIKNKVSQLSQVESASISPNLPIYRASGSMMMDEEGKEMLFSSRSFMGTPDYIRTFGIQLIAGEELPDEITEGYNGVLVNETFVERMQWKDSPLGKTINDSGWRMEVVGIVKDFQLGTLYENKSVIEGGPQPLMIRGKTNQGWGNWGTERMIIRFNHLDLDLQADMTQLLQETLGNNEAIFTPYNSLINELYISARLFRDSIVVASLLMLLITLLGLVGYTADEIGRRSKEIAIRKITGATSGNILQLISKDILLISLPAIIIGIMISYMTGAQWLQQFAIKIPLNAPLFLVSGLAVVLVILLCVTLRTWKVANDDPVNSIKAE